MFLPFAKLMSDLPETLLTVPIGLPLTLTIEEAMCRQADAAIDAFLRGHFDVALTLAGAAEGVIERTGLHMFGELRSAPKALERFATKSGSPS
ncbi:hypothetical protein ACFQX9_16430 [Bradyrhizobium sp. GCM10028915]|uniref:hypothetical protein n=1 Tax=Bradyrhizobium sp. GCM10028915 TaxID=3273385 RepID=UPI003622ACF7